MPAILSLWQHRGSRTLKHAILMVQWQPKDEWLCTQEGPPHTHTHTGEQKERLEGHGDAFLHGNEVAEFEGQSLHCTHTHQDLMMPTSMCISPWQQAAELASSLHTACTHTCTHTRTPCMHAHTHTRMHRMCQFQITQQKTKNRISGILQEGHCRTMLWLKLILRHALC